MAGCGGRRQLGCEIPASARHGPGFWLPPPAEHGSVQNNVTPRVGDEAAASPHRAQELAQLSTLSEAIRHVRTGTPVPSSPSEVSALRMWWGSAYSRDSHGAKNSNGSTPCPLSAQQRQTQPLTATAPPAPRCHVPTGMGPQPVGPQPAHGGRAGHQAASSTAAPCAACPHRWHPTKPQARSQRQSQALRSPPARWKAQSRLSLATAALAACSPSTFTQLNVLA